MYKNVYGHGGSSIFQAQGLWEDLSHQKEALGLGNHYIRVPKPASTGKNQKKSKKIEAGVL